MTESLDIFRDVSEWMDARGLLDHDHEKMVAVQRKLVAEEELELWLAMTEGDRPAELKEWLDVCWVHLGMAAVWMKLATRVFGPDVVERGWRELKRSNDSKGSTPDENGKIPKDGYSPADMARVLGVES